MDSDLLLGVPGSIDSGLSDPASYIYAVSYPAPGISGSDGKRILANVFIFWTLRQPGKPCDVPIPLLALLPASQVTWCA